MLKDSPHVAGQHGADDFRRGGPRGINGVGEGRCSCCSGSVGRFIVSARSSSPPGAHRGILSALILPVEERPCDNTFAAWPLLRARSIGPLEGEYHLSSIPFTAPPIRAA